MHSRTKHLKIWHNFIRDHIVIRDCIIKYINTKHQLVDIFTKPLARDRFYDLIRDLGIINGDSLS